MIIIDNNNNNFPVALKYPDWRLVGNSHVSWAGETLFSLGWPSPRDGVSIKILVEVQPKNHRSSDEC